MSVPKKLGPTDIPSVDPLGGTKKWNSPPSPTKQADISIVWIEKQFVEPATVGDPDIPERIYYKGTNAPVKNGPMRIPSAVIGLVAEDLEDFLSITQTIVDQRGTLIGNTPFRMSADPTFGIGPGPRRVETDFSVIPPEEYVGGELMIVVDEQGLIETPVTSLNPVTYSPGTEAVCKDHFPTTTHGNAPSPGTVFGTAPYESGKIYTPNSDSTAILAFYQAHKVRFSRILIIMRTSDTPTDILAGSAGISCRLTGPAGVPEDEWPVGVTITVASVVGSTSTSITAKLAALRSLFAPLGASFLAINYDLTAAVPVQEIAEACRDFIQAGLDL